MSTSLFIRTWSLRSLLDDFLGVSLIETEWLLFLGGMLIDFFTGMLTLLFLVNDYYF